MYSVVSILVVSGKVVVVTDAVCFGVEVGDKVVGIDSVVSILDVLLPVGMVYSVVSIIVVSGKVVVLTDAVCFGVEIGGDVPRVHFCSPCTFSRIHFV